MTVEELERQVAAGDSAEARVELADRYGRLGRLRDAIHLYRSAIALGLPVDADVAAYLGCAGCYRGLGNYFRAARLLEEASERHPQVHALAAMLALTRYKVGMYEEAVRGLAHCLLETSTDESIQTLRETLQHYADTLEEPRSESEYRHVHHD